MDIKQAKEEIKHTVEAYLSKNAAGEYRIPAIRQRPILMMGPPGIGKTQIMEQIARECRVGLVAYTITHHTRQSAVGLPFIIEEEFEGQKCSVTEYTMSEIIASIYRKMREEGVKEGILFIDEINCVSETLAPTMLQFLQCKTFGNQRVPEGWIIVAAGNPPEYNRSVRDFDMVTLDRVRYMELEASLGAWQEYAHDRRIHGAILSYLELRQKNFYRVETDVDGMHFVTARGWEDLSSLMQAYEALGLPLDREIIQEYLHHPEVAEDAAAYFELYKKYREDYGIPEILKGRVKPWVYANLERAAFDERLSVVNLLLDGLRLYAEDYVRERYITDAWYGFLKGYREKLTQTEDAAALYEQLLKERQEILLQKKAFEEADDISREKYLTGLLEEKLPEKGMTGEQAFETVRKGFTAQTERLEETEQELESAIGSAFDFMEQAFEGGQEMVVFVTGLTLDKGLTSYLAEHTNARYLKYNEELLIGTKRAELIARLERE